MSAIASDVRQLAEAGINRNADWTPYIQEINGVKMALVPAGCFQMGSTDEQLDDILELCEQDQNPLSRCRRSDHEDEQPAHEVCFERPFWIDVYEVTNAQFGVFDGQAILDSYNKGPASPHDMIFWAEAKAFCQKRGVRLLTEAEWEYTARGPDGLVYPWGNEFIADNVVYEGTSGGQSWIVSKRSGDISWIGAYDLAGNVEEWVNDWYGAYPSERQVAPTGPESGEYYVLRGGSWATLMSDTNATRRHIDTPGGSGNTNGFRCGGDVSALR